MQDVNGTDQTTERQATTAVADQADTKTRDAHPALATILDSKRWRQREEPFQGFGSPEGKF